LAAAGGRDMMYEHCYICLHECNREVCDQCGFDKFKKQPTKFEPLPIKGVTYTVSTEKAIQTEQKSDPVNHPSHYETGKFECIEVMKEVFGIEAVQNFCLLNAFKYLYRCENKANKTEDIKKSQWYENKYLELESEKHGKS
jgi:hypothetical protein